MKAHLENTELFPAFVHAEARESQQRLAAEPPRRLAEPRQQLSLCWSAPRPCPGADLYNGERLRGDLTEVWPPVSLLSAQRHERQTGAATLTAAQRPLGTVPSDAQHPWDTGERGPEGSPKAGKSVLRCPHCQVTFYERPTCPSCGKVPAFNLATS